MMAVMDLFKKYYDKVLLALALLVLFGSGVYLAIRVGTLNALIEQPASLLPSAGQAAVPLDLSIYTNDLTAVQQPPLWKEMPHDPFFSETRTVVTKTTTTTVPVVVESPRPVATLLRVTYKPFKFQFKEYQGTGRNFQINLADGNKQFFVDAIGEEIRDPYATRIPEYLHTGYFVKKFEQIKTGPRPSDDQSQLTIQRDGEEPLVLVKGRLIYDRDPSAVFQVRGDDTEREIHRGQSFVCDRKTYNVVDISPTQMLIIDTQSNEKITIQLGKPVADRPQPKDEHTQ